MFHIWGLFQTHTLFLLVFMLCYSRRYVLVLRISVDFDRQFLFQIAQ